MKSVVEFDIQAPHDKVAALFADPGNNLKWMHDLDRCEPMTGSPGMPGSTYRMVPKKGEMGRRTAPTWSPSRTLRSSNCDVAARKRR
jgi:hypothetical protein